MTWPMVWENWYTLMVMFMRDNLLMKKHMVKEHILMQMVLRILDNGNLINNMGLVLKYGQMALSMKDFMSMV